MVWVVPTEPLTVWLLMLWFRVVPPGPLPSEDARLEEELECLPSSWGFCWGSPELGFPPRLRSPSLEGAGALGDFPGMLFIPGFGIPLREGAAASFLALLSLPPLGMKLAILEDFFGISVAAAPLGSSLGPSLRSGLSVTEALLARSLLFSFSFSRCCFSFSFSLPFGELFLVVSARLNVLWAMPLSAILGLLEAGPAVESVRPVASISSLSSTLDRISSRSQLVSRDPGPSPALEAPLLLKSFSFSSMDFWVLGAGFKASGLGLGASGTGCLTESMDDVALCFTLMDLLRQGLVAAPGWGMAEETPQLARVELLPLSKEAGALSLIPGWEEAGLAKGSVEMGKKGD